MFKCNTYDEKCPICYWAKQHEIASAEGTIIRAEFKETLELRHLRIDALSTEVGNLREIIQVVLTAHELKGGEFEGLKIWINEELTSASTLQSEK